jgi:hypothetical protein
MAQMKTQAGPRTQAFKSEAAAEVPNPKLQPQAGKTFKPEPGVVCDRNGDQ